MSASEGDGYGFRDTDAAEGQDDYGLAGQDDHAPRGRDPLLNLGAAHEGVILLRDGKRRDPLPEAARFSRSGLRIAYAGLPKSPVRRSPTPRAVKPLRKPTPLSPHRRKPGPSKASQKLAEKLRQSAPEKAAPGPKARPALFPAPLTSAPPPPPAPRRHPQAQMQSPVRAPIEGAEPLPAARSMPSAPMAQAAFAAAEPDWAPATPVPDPSPAPDPRPASVGLGVADLRNDPPDPALFLPGAVGSVADPVLLLTLRMLPWQTIAGEIVWVTDLPAPPATLAALARAQGLMIGEGLFAVAETRAFEAAFAACYGPRLARRAERAVPAAESVRGLWLLRGRAALLLTLAVTLAIAAGDAGLLALLGAVFLVTTLTGLLRFAALGAALFSAKPDPRANPILPDAPRQGQAPAPLWPRISLLVPLFREAEMVPRILSAIDRLDYPRDRLEVKLVVEMGDAATRGAIAGMALPDWAGVIAVPDGQPRTKPRALNYALAFCRGEVIGILDAEDRPEPGQLRAVAGAFRALPESFGAVQCQLSYFNARENWITRCFQLEYGIWFGVLLRGFERLGLPIPLGGTSVYFRREALEEVGGWDAHNVTEDADLGMRLYRRGLRTRVLTATTEEEANCRLLPWVRQRSRWLKGYLLTWLSHVRRPVSLWREMGPVGFLGFNVLFLGAACSYLAMPLFWISLLGWMVTGQTPWDRLLPDWAFWPLTLSLAGGQALMLGTAALAMWRRRALDLLLFVPLLPVYWTLGALAAWKAVLELFVAPYYWDKTRHGVSRMMGSSDGPPRRILRMGQAPVPEARFTSPPSPRRGIFG